MPFLPPYILTLSYVCTYNNYALQCIALAFSFISCMPPSTISTLRAKTLIIHISKNIVAADFEFGEYCSNIVGIWCHTYWAWHTFAIMWYKTGRFSPLLEALLFHGGAMVKLQTLDLVRRHDLQVKQELSL